MTIDDKIRDEKLRSSKISVLCPGKVDKYKYLIDKEILPSDQRSVISQAKFADSPLITALEKQTKMIEVWWEKQI